MAAFLNVKNNAASVLASGITNVATSVTLVTGEGARFPSSNFHITIDNEILLCSSRSGDVLTVTRAKESTEAAAHSAGTPVRLNITAAIIEELRQNKSNVIWKDTPVLILNIDNQSSPIDWTDIDLTAHTSPDAKFALLFLMLKAGDCGTSGATMLYVRKNGTAATVPFIRVQNQFIDWVELQTTTFVGLDSGQVMEYKLTLATGADYVYADIYLLGYIE